MLQRRGRAPVGLGSVDRERPVRHREVDPDHVGGVLRAEPAGEQGAPIAAVGGVAPVAKSLGHQRIECGGDAGQAPSRLPGLPAEAEAGQVGDDEIERIGGVPPVVARPRQWPGDLREFDHRSGPPVQEQERQRIRSRPADVPEMQVEAVDLAQELRWRVQPLLLPAPVVAGAPHLAELSDLVHADSVVPAGALDLLRPAGPAQAIAEVIEHCVRDVDPVRTELHGHAV